MIIREVIERECCQHNDLVPLLGTYEDVVTERTTYYPEECPHKICIHCGAIWEYYRYTDAAGSMDWNYRKIESDE